MKLKGFDSDAVKSLMTGFKWYKYSRQDCMQSQSLVALHPNNRVFVNVGYNETYGSYDKEKDYGFGCAYDGL
jgi:hypothetical protein